MRTICPDCGERTEGRAGATAFCAVCGREWVVVPANPATSQHPFEFEVDRGAGPEGPYDRLYLREALYTGRLDRDDRVRVPGSSQWERVEARPEFAEILDIVGKSAGGRSRLGGWRPAAAAPRAEVPRPEVPPQPRPKPSSGAPLLLVAAGVLVVIAIVTALVLS